MLCPCYPGLLGNAQTWTNEQESHAPEELSVPYRNSSCLQVAKKQSMIQCYGL